MGYRPRSEDGPTLVRSVAIWPAARVLSEARNASPKSRDSPTRLRAGPTYSAPDLPHRDTPQASVRYVLVQRSFKSPVLFPVLAGALLLTACEASGGGTLPSAGSCSAGGRQGATFGFHAYQTFDSPMVSFAGDYTDRCAGVMLNSSGQLKPMGRPDFTPAPSGYCLSGPVPYTSVNPAKPGSGTLTLMVCDAGQPAGDGTDYISISMDSDTGPYSGYSNAGMLTTGRPSPDMGTGNFVVRF